MAAELECLGLDDIGGTEENLDKSIREAFENCGISPISYPHIHLLFYEKSNSLGWRQRLQRIVNELGQRRIKPRRLGTGNVKEYGPIIRFAFKSCRCECFYCLMQYLQKRNYDMGIKKMGDEPHSRCAFHSSEGSGSRRIDHSRFEKLCATIESASNPNNGTYKLGITEREKTSNCEDGEMLRSGGEHEEETQVESKQEESSTLSISDLLEKSCATDLVEFDQWLVQNGYGRFLHQFNFAKHAEIALRSAQLMCTGSKWEDIILKTPLRSSDMSLEDSKRCIETIIDHNRWKIEEFMDHAYMVLNKQHQKKNTLFFFGPPNCGKTLLALSMVRSTKFWANIQNFESNFFLQDGIGKRAILMNEPRIDDKKFETIKNVFEGCDVSIDVKHLKSQVLKRVPVIVTSNLKIAYYTKASDFNETTLASRTFRYNFQTCEELKFFTGTINPHVWLYFIKEFIF